MLLYYDDQNIIRIASTTPVVTNLYKTVEVPDGQIDGKPTIGRKLVFGVPSGKIRLAVICNWGDRCGIATYTRFLMDALRPLLADVKIFAEDNAVVKDEDDGDYAVDYCWKRGESMASSIRKVVDWKPTLVLVQHEFGIFPRATHLLQMFQMLSRASIPCIITLHSVYEHLDKVVCTAAMSNIIVHSQTGLNCLRRLGHNSRIVMIPHGCVSYENVQENWNITQTPYAVIQFGFGFAYKGVDVALEAIARLKAMFPRKYGGDTPIHYCYLCSESSHNIGINNSYYQSLLSKIDDLGLADNAVVIRGFQDANILNQYLRTYKLAIFPYVTDPKNVVFGASGAIRVAMANQNPTIASASVMYDDLEGVVPRPRGAEALAGEIDRFFSDGNLRGEYLARQNAYIDANSWAITAKRYLDFLESRVNANLHDVVIV